MSAIATARAEYAALGLDVIPLQPGTKVPLARSGWTTLAPAQQWADAPDDCNLGLRCGGARHLVVLDCDEKSVPGTFDRARNWLAGLGLAVYPTVVTASGIGRHIGLMLATTLPGAYRLLCPQFGAGELRYGPGAMAVAPPSSVDGRQYALIAGDYRQLPTVTLADLLPLIGPEPPEQPAPAPMAPTHNGAPFAIPRRTRALLEGKPDKAYRSRSEIEHAAIVGLVNVGFDLDGVTAVFMRYRPAKFTEMYAANPASALTWLRKSYDAALLWSSAQQNPARQTAEAARAWAEARPWPGRTGAVDRAVFLAHCSLAHRACRAEYAASSRDLADLAGCTQPTASAATRRLAGQCLVIVARQAVADCATVYSLSISLSLPHKGGAKEVINLYTHHDLFRPTGLGKVAGQVWTVLAEGPATVAALVARTGRCEQAVRRALARMAGVLDVLTGELVPMVIRVGDSWQMADGVDLDYLATLVGTAGAGERQRARHDREREAHHLALSEGRKALE